MKSEWHECLRKQRNIACKYQTSIMQNFSKEVQNYFMQHWSYLQDSHERNNSTLFEYYSRQLYQNLPNCFKVSMVNSSQLKFLPGALQLNVIWTMNDISKNNILILCAESKFYLMLFLGNSYFLFIYVKLLIFWLLDIYIYKLFQTVKWKLCQVFSYNGVERILTLEWLYLDSK